MPIGCKPHLLEFWKVPKIFGRIATLPYGKRSDESATVYQQTAIHCQKWRVQKNRRQKNRSQNPEISSQQPEPLAREGDDHHPKAGVEVPVVPDEPDDGGGRFRIVFVPIPTAPFGPNLLFVFLVAIRHPFKDIAGHVPKTIGAAPGGVHIDRRGLAQIAFFGVGAGKVKFRCTPRIVKPMFAARRGFPFGAGGQAHHFLFLDLAFSAPLYCQPGAVGFGLKPTDADHRLAVAIEAGIIPPARFLPLSLRFVPASLCTPPLFIPIATRVHKAAILVVGDRIFADFERNAQGTGGIDRHQILQVSRQMTEIVQ